MTALHRILVVTLLAALAGCCPCERTPARGLLPPPISLDEQARRLAECSYQLPQIKATTVVAGVRLDYRDDKGQDRTVNAEGLLQIRQRVPGIAMEPTLVTPAEVLLSGTAFDQPAFEAGRNATNWWFAIKLDTKKAWMGDPTKPLDFSTLGKEGSASILRADLVPDLLGLSPLPPNKFFPALPPQAGLMMPDSQKAGDGPFLMMVVNDAEGTDELFIGRIFQGSRPFLSRQIIVDRRSGHVVEVRLYNTEGTVAVRSQLSNYAPVTYADGVEKPATSGGVPEFPKKVVVSYPGQFLTVSLEFAEVKVVGEFKPAVFMTPDFETQGLKVIPVE